MYLWSLVGWLPVAFDLHVPMGSCGCSCMYLWGLVGVLPVAFYLLWSLVGWLPVAFDLLWSLVGWLPPCVPFFLCTYGSRVITYTMKLKTAKCKVREGNKAPCGQGHRICKGSKVHVGKRWRQSREQITHMNVWRGRAVRVWCSVQEIGHVSGCVACMLMFHHRYSSGWEGGRD